MDFFFLISRSDGFDLDGLGDFDALEFDIDKYLDMNDLDDVSCNLQK